MELQTRIIRMHEVHKLENLEGWLGDDVGENAESVYPVFKTDDFKRLLNAGVTIIGMFCQTTLVGYIAYKSRLNGTLNLQRMAVHYMYRRCGIASTLIDTMIEYCEEFDDVLITVKAPDVLTPFHLLLRKNGFKAITAARNKHDGHDYVFSLLTKVRA